MCIALNKKQFPNIQMNGGGDVCQPTLDGKLISPENVPYEKIAIWNYDLFSKQRRLFHMIEQDLRGHGILFEITVIEAVLQKKKSLMLG